MPDYLNDPNPQTWPQVAYPGPNPPPPANPPAVIYSGANPPAPVTGAPQVSPPPAQSVDEIAALVSGGFATLDATGKVPATQFAARGGGQMILERSWFSDLSDFYAVTAPAPVPAADGTIPLGGASNFNTTFLKFYRNADPAVDIDAVIRVNSVGSTNYGPVIGCEQLGYVGLGSSWGIQFSCYDATTAPNGNDIKFLPQVNNGGPALWRRRIPGGVKAGDVVRVTVMVREHAIACVLNNLMTGGHTSFSFDLNAGSTARTTAGFKFGTRGSNQYKIGSFGPSGYASLVSLKVVSRSVKDPWILCVGDSKTRGHNAGWAFQRWTEYLNALGPTTTWAGSGDKTAEILQSIDVAAAQRPKNVILCIGRNDVQQSVALATIQTNYQQIVAAFTAVGSKVLHLISPPENSTFDTVTMAPLNNWLKATYPNDWIEASVASGYLYAWSSDGVHPNSEGGRFIARTIIASGKIAAMPQTAADPSADPSSWTGYSPINLLPALECPDYAVLTPTEGGTVTAGFVRDVSLTPAAALTATTLTLPSNPVDGQFCHVSNDSTFNITTLNLAAASGTVLPTSVSTASANSFCMRWVAAANQWVLWSNLSG